MKWNASKVVFTCLLVIGLLMPSATINAQDQSKTAGKLPEVSELIAKHIKACGGAEKLKAVQSLTAVMDLEVESPQFNLGGEGKIVQTAEGKMLMEIDIDNFGKIRSGYDGKTAWEIAPMAKPAVLSGSRAVQMKYQSAIFPLLTPKKFYADWKCTGKKKFGDEDCFVVVASQKDVKPLTLYFSAKSGLNVGSEQVTPSPQGDMKAVTSIGGYKEVSGIKMPFSTSVELPIMTQKIEVKSYEFDKKVDKKTFRLPKSIENMNS